ncbi:hypothetical protein C943_04468 [Mariniradius saccharolyticus AK6]|uniref:Uncharacterized protein n=1 Tax=Mariniradius saccharolyticus AK6 TaxID=1239962 RepID=M7XFE8_9BACT|nr:hypothetical protein C943_04468 [Mariniradius saccharolyticus AK6]
MPKILSYNSALEIWRGGWPGSSFEEGIQEKRKERKKTK